MEPGWWNHPQGCGSLQGGAPVVARVVGLVLGFGDGHSLPQMGLSWYSSPAPHARVDSALCRAIPSPVKPQWPRWPRWPGARFAGSCWAGQTQGARPPVPSLSPRFMLQTLFYSWMSLICSSGKLPIPGMDLSPSCRPDLPRLKREMLGRQLWSCFWSVLLVTRASPLLLPHQWHWLGLFLLFFSLSSPLSTLFFLWGFKLSGLFCVFEKTSFKTSVKLVSKGSTSHWVHRAGDWILQFKGAAGSFTHLNGWCLVLKKTIWSSWGSS